MSKPVNGRPALSDEVKRRLKPLIIELRRTLEEDLERELRRLGLDSSKDSPLPVERLSYLTDQERAIRAELEAILAKEQESIGSYAGALEAVRREAAYTHLNRLVGLKCLELRGHLVIEGEPTEAVTCRAEFGGRSKWLWTLRSRHSQYRHGAQAEELLWREGLLGACAAVTQEIGVLFDPADPYAQVWPSFRTLRTVVDRLNELPEDAFRTDELLGWVYQYFQTEEKEKVTAGESFTQKLKKTKKYTGPDIATYTALYTERYMVDFLLQNSIGAYWMEMYPDSPAKEAWQYYVTPATPHTRLPKPLKEWKLLDPAMGSGHFLVVAFDLLAQLYEEERRMEAEGRLPRGWSVPAEQTARVILENNLHGIDIDLRAVQLAALALYLKAKELGWDEAGGPPRLNLVVADAVLTRGEAYEHLLAQYQDDPAVQEAIRAIWHSLEHVRELGSLVRVEEEVDLGVMKSKSKNETETPLISSARNWIEYKESILQRLASALALENHSNNLEYWIFRLEGHKGIGLLTLLSHRYDIVCTNPPYIGSKHMGQILKSYITEHYSEGKSDAYTAFILRCRDLVAEGGYVAMVTQHSWMFLGSFEVLRSILIQETCLTLLAHLGPKTFLELSNTNALGFVLFIFCSRRPRANDKTISFRLVHEKSKELSLLNTIYASNKGCHGAKYRIFLTRNEIFKKIPKNVLFYWAPPSIIDAFLNERTLSQYVEAKQGLITGDNDRFLRAWWEVNDAYWIPYMKGGSYCRWFGNQELVVNWKNNGEEIKNLKTPSGRQKSRPQNLSYYFREGGTWTGQSSYGFSVRLMPHGFIFDAKGPAFFPKSANYSLPAFIALANSKVIQFSFTALQPTVDYGEGYFMSLPAPHKHFADSELHKLGNTAIELKKKIVMGISTERIFRQSPLEVSTAGSLYLRWFEDQTNSLISILHTIEGLVDRIIYDAYQLNEDDLQAIISDTGVSSGLYPIIKNLSTLPQIAEQLEISLELQSFINNHDRKLLSESEMGAIKDKLKTYYTSGFDPYKSFEEDSFNDVLEEDNPLPNTTEVLAPTETFIEKLSQKLEIHPISVYWLIQELKQEGIVYPAELQQMTEDFLSVKLLRILGHRWPLQDSYEQESQALFIPSSFVSADGIVLLANDTGQGNLIDTINRLLDEEFGPENGHTIEREAGFILGWMQGDEWGKQKPTTIALWFEREFFKRHVSQFKRRPIAWHLTSPKGAFQAIVYYHKFDKDRLKLLRSRYVSETLKELRRQLGEAQNQAALDRWALDRAAELEEKIADVEEFDRRLGLLQEGRQREARIWVPWKSPEEQPVGWDPDINDGVRVNIAPVQRLGLLAAEVLSKKDLDSLLAPEGR